MAVPRVILSEHAIDQAVRRNIAESVILEVVKQPAQVIVLGRRRQVRQSRIVSAEGREHLVRVIVEVSGRDIVVVTVYRTSKISRYWSQA